MIPLLISTLLWPAGDKGPDTAFEYTACQEDPALATLAPDADVYPEPDYLPLVTATGVLLLEADHVSQPYLGDHWLTCCMSRAVLVNLVTQCCGGLTGGFVEVLPGGGVQNLT